MTHLKKYTVQVVAIRNLSLDSVIQERNLVIPAGIKNSVPTMDPM